jgi:hypothetical protein
VNSFQNEKVIKMVKYVKLPFAMQRAIDTATERAVTEPLEIAMVLCDLEHKQVSSRFSINKLSALFRGNHSTEKMAFVIKAYWPFWLVPFEREKSLLLDGLGLFSRTFYHPEIPNADEFIKDISLEEGKLEPFEISLDRHRFRHRHFADMRSVTITGMIPQDNLIRDLLIYLHHSWAEVSDESTMLTPRLSLSQSKDKAQEFISLKNACERDIEKLNLSDKGLLKSVSEYIEQVDIRKQQVEDQYARKIAEFQVAINKRVADLMRSCQAEAEIVITNANMKLDTLKKRYEEQEKSESEFESRIVSNRSKIIELKKRIMKAGEHETGYLNKAIGDMEAAVVHDQEELALVVKQKQLLGIEAKATEVDREKRLAAIRTRYDVQIKSERDKIMNLVREKDKLLVVLEGRKGSIQDKREDISEQILQLRERLKDYRFVELEKGCVTLPPQLAGIEGILLPVYIARFESEESGRYEVLSPAVVNEGKGVEKLKSLINMAKFLEPRSSSFGEVLNETFRRALQNNSDLSEELNRKAETANLLTNPNVKEMFNEGLLIMKEEDLISKRRYSSLKSNVALQLA